MERDEKITLLFETLDNLSVDELTKSSWRRLVPGLSDERIEEVTRFSQRESRLGEILPQQAKEPKAQEEITEKPISEPIEPVKKPRIKEEITEPRVPEIRELTEIKEIKEQPIMSKKPSIYNVDLAKEQEVDRVISSQGFELPPWDRRAIRQVAIQTLKTRGRIERNDVEKIIQETIKDISSQRLDKFINELSEILAEKKELKISQPPTIPSKREKISRPQVPPSPPPMPQPEKPSLLPPRPKPSRVKSIKSEVPKPKLEAKITKREIQSPPVPKSEPKSSIPKSSPIPVSPIQQAKREPISKISEEEVQIGKMQDISSRGKKAAPIEINPNLKDQLDKVYSKTNLTKNLKDIVGETIEVVKDLIKKAKDDEEKDKIREEAARYIRWREDMLRFEGGVSLASKVKEVRSEAVDEIYG